ncbi:hypothetical protein Asera_05470 [Actinocatenispora sera]|uniref:Aminoglycoside phosphotransferase domain-containing protein n=1 Tax=Actinocatenispora sera TaxID=390989 RepID=A0A810KVR5_9ACTN|nr:hypothetical protein Asera_05470 [Actinocatenispora sera]
MRAAVPGFDRLVAGTYRRLRTLPVRPGGLLHGDLCLPNVLIGSNLYDPLGRDGHFAWCVRVLADPGITALLR